MDVSLCVIEWSFSLRGTHSSAAHHDVTSSSLSFVSVSSLSLFPFSCFYSFSLLKGLGAVDFSVGRLCTIAESIITTLVYWAFSQTCETSALLYLLLLYLISSYTGSDMFVLLPLCVWTDPRLCPWCWRHRFWCSAGLRSVSESHTVNGTQIWTSSFISVNIH